MAEIKDEIKVLNLEVTYKDVFSMEWLYKLIRSWLISENFITDLDDGANSERWMETNHIQRTTAAGKEIIIWWRTKKPAPNQYFDYVINVDYHTLGLNDVEILVNGQKMKLQKGEIRVDLVAKLSVHKAEWEKNKILRKFYTLFRKRIYKAQLDAAENELREDVYRLQGAIRKYLEIKGFAAETSLFAPPKGKVEA